MLGSILGGQKDRDQQGPVADMIPQMGGDPYGGMSQSIDPAAMAMLNAPPQNGSAQIAQYAIDNDDIIEIIKSELRGFRLVREYNVDKEQYEFIEQRFGSPKMNEKGINETIFVLRMFLSKPMALSNMPKDYMYRIDIICFIVGKKLAAMYATQATQFDLDRNSRSMLAVSIVTLAHFHMMRSYEDGERPRMYGSHKTLQSIQGYSGVQAPASKKFMGIFG